MVLSVARALPERTLPTARQPRCIPKIISKAASALPPADENFVTRHRRRQQGEGGESTEIYIFGKNLVFFSKKILLAAIFFFATWIDRLWSLYLCHYMFFLFISATIVSLFFIAGRYIYCGRILKCMLFHICGNEIM
jgi:hypothetical protein